MLSSFVQFTGAGILNWTLCTAKSLCMCMCVKLYSFVDARGYHNWGGRSKSKIKKQKKIVCYVIQHYCNRCANANVFLSQDFVSTYCYNVFFFFYRPASERDFFFLTLNLEFVYVIYFIETKWVCFFVCVSSYQRGN